MGSLLPLEGAQFSLHAIVAKRLDGRTRHLEV